jgi:hypothetical protein|tara:strand:+ start:1967 stop:2392 length:426 start_codon:yes stop_codon:yes gene_type:complete
MAKKRNLGRYASGLEKYCADALKANGLKFDYEPKYTIMEGFNYPSTYLKSVPKQQLMVDRSNANHLPITYKPDFLLPHHNVFIETKGFVRRNDSFPLRWKLFMKYLVDSGMGHYDLFIPRNQKQVDQIVNFIQNEHDARKT